MCFRGLMRFRELSAVNHKATNHWCHEVNYIQVCLYCLAKMHKPPHYCEHKLPTFQPMLLGFCGPRCTLFHHLFPMTLFHVSCSKLKKLSEDSLTKQPEEVFDVLEKLGEGWVSWFFHEQHFSFQMCGLCLLLRHFCFTWSNLCCLPSLVITFVFSSYIVCVCSSYGSVFKAIHKESGQVVAIKQVPVESDLQEIIKEISIMQQCDR